MLPGYLSSSDLVSSLRMCIIHSYLHRVSSACWAEEKEPIPPMNSQHLQWCINEVNKLLNKISDDRMTGIKVPKQVGQ